MKENIYMSSPPQEEFIELNEYLVYIVYVNKCIKILQFLCSLHTAFHFIRGKESIHRPPQHTIVIESNHCPVLALPI